MFAASRLPVIAIVVIAVGCHSETSQLDVAAGSSDLNQVPKQSALDQAGASLSIQFEDTAAACGVLLSLPQQPRPMRTLESFGCGCAAFDFDNDGWQDVLIVSDPVPTLYRNDQSGKFINVGQPVGLNSLPPANRTGCAVGDFDGDGWQDILFTGYRSLCLCRNLRGEKFEDVTSTVGLDPHNHRRWGAGAGFMDLDGDQWLELVILNYVHFGDDTRQFCDNGKGLPTSCPPKVYEPEFGEIYRNVEGKHFELSDGIHGMANTNGVGLVLAFSDLNEDGRCDFYIGNDARNADLMVNLGGLHFQNEGLSSGLAMSRRSEAVAAMGADWGDFDRDGRLDLSVTDFQDKGAVLFRNLGNMVFADVSEKSGIARETARFLGFGLNWMDFENDGWLDIAYVHGHVYENIADWRHDVAYKQPIAMMHNISGKSFINIIPSQQVQVSRALAGRGSASLDFDNDGRMDFLVVDYEGPVMLLHNRTKSENHWLKLQLRGRSPNTLGYGAKIKLAIDGEEWIEQVSPSASYLSSKDPRVHFGLGHCDHIDEITIEWASGIRQTINHANVDQILTVTEPKPSQR